MKVYLREIRLLFKLFEIFHFDSWLSVTYLQQNPQLEKET